MLDPTPWVEFFNWFPGVYKNMVNRGQKSVEDGDAPKKLVESVVMGLSFS